METAAAAAPEAPAIRTVFGSVVVAATPKIRPKMETVPSSMPKTIVPAELTNEVRNRCRTEPSSIGLPPLLSMLGRAALSRSFTITVQTL